MNKLFQKKIIIPFVAFLFLFISAGFRNDFFEIAKQIEIFTTLFKELNKNYVDDVTPGILMDKAIKSMLNELDPYTNYFNEQDVLQFRIRNTGEYTGIGALISNKEGKIILKEIYKNSASDKANLKAGDEIIQIGDVLVSDFKDDSSKLLQGSKNTKIEIVYLRQGKKNNAQLILDEVDIKSVPFFGKIDEKTGYIVLTHFTKKASEEVKEALEDLKKQGAEKIVLDLRGNPGGLLNEAVSICNLFVPKNQIIVTTKSRIEKNSITYKTSAEPIDTKIPLIIIVNEKSASASEIVAGALQDLDRAIVVGCRSFGKGLVQKPIDLVYGTQLKVTISRYYTPSGRCIQALDYLHKDENGVATRTDFKNYNSYKTTNGRVVYDGGGILPDVEFDQTKNSTIIDQLIKNDAIFNFSTDYFYRNQPAKNLIPVLTNNDFLDFKNFLKTTSFTFETETEAALKKLSEAAKQEKIDKSIELEYLQLKKSIENNREEQLNKNQKEILTLITNELVKRYQYQDGFYKYYIENNFEIKEASSIINDSEKYSKILKP